MAYEPKPESRTEHADAPEWKLGKSHRKVDAMERMRGVTRYTDDIKLPGLLHCKILRSPHAHAKILSIDTSRAEAMDGVHAVVTGEELSIPYGIIPWTPDETALAVGKVCYVGDGVAAVAAVDEDTAIAACAAIEVLYEPLPAYYDPEKSLEATAKNADGSYTGADGKGVAINPYARRGNRSKNVVLEFGEVDPAIDQAELIIEGDYFFEGTTHGAIEPHCAVAKVEPNGMLTVWSATQVSHYLHRELAKVLERPANTIRVIQPPLGGAFGGKSEPFDLEFCVAKLAMKTGRPVKCLYTREEVFYSHRGRHPMKMKYRTGFTKEGKITGVAARTFLDGGAYSSFGLVTTYYSGQLLCAPYRFPAYRFHSTRAYTNKPACGPKRGHGSVQPRFAIEVQMDKAAVELGLDPFELRRRNDIGAGGETVNDFKIGSNGFLECLEQVEAASEWTERKPELGYGRGLGVAGSTYISGTNYPIYPNDMPQAAVQVTLDRSGRARVFSGANDIGQGSNTMLAVIVAAELGLELDDVRVLSADTDLCPVDLGAYSSRITLMVGNACMEAAQKLRRKVRESVAKRWEVPKKRVTLVERKAMDIENPEQSVPIAEAFQWAESDHGLLGEIGSYNTPKDRHGDYRGGTIGASPAYSFTAHVADVSVDPETGVVTVHDIWVAHDCGKALSRRIVEGQMEGSAYMGFGEAIMERHDVDPDHSGVHIGPSLLDYRMPTFLDTPDLHALIVEAPDPQGPYGAKEAGEGPLHPSIPAIANAIYDAVGVRIDTLPFSPPKVLAAILERQEKERNGELPVFKADKRGDINDGRRSA
ncbi:Aldehyde oxidase and xanthine dehydrogenase, molybdopterin binding protein [Plesiocystis pacifica SIR-1]|uniref:Aldehyde oxidase and xanthine dehydrogenase, molybdopterin binding protein n=1 Tax=Plesiocystis pacifica SIR-1 TaxID=391625 RepID=A6GFV5_9BACT|nr:xanthine dehydrogenase family protein molybdopterin-binding subunit [Plesiocystis pacifica]EDM75253.1 Aldehyde oxidase and xanthine dehydrogenase, molybdopterin binding protein [Plesiocystis pacifica SIR-1]